MAAWNTDDIPDLTGKRALVTGANSGIGYWTALHLARAGAEVVLACRSIARAEAARAELLAAVPAGRFEILLLDLADLESLRRAAELFRRRYERLDILCNNAGIALAPLQRTAQGFESQFGCNFLGHFALTGLLIEPIRASAGSRVVHVGSLAHRFGRIDFDDPNFQRRRYSPWASYGQSKLAGLMFMRELDRRFRRAGLDAISVGAHPGMSGTNIGGFMPIVSRPLFRKLSARAEALILNAPHRAAEPTLLAATQSGFRGGDYVGPGGWMEIKGPVVPARLSPAALNEPDARRLWDLAEQLTGVRFLSEAFAQPDSPVGAAGARR